MDLFYKAAQVIKSRLSKHYLLASFGLVLVHLGLLLGCVQEPLAPLPIPKVDKPTLPPPIAPPAPDPKKVSIEKALNLPYLPEGEFSRGAPNIRVYCLMHRLGDQFYLTENSVHGWACNDSKTGKINKVDFNVLCADQYRYSTSFGFDNPSDPASVYCKIDGEYPQPTYLHEKDFSPYQCDSLGICTLRDFVFYSQTDPKILEGLNGADLNLWKHLEYDEGLCAPTAITMALETLFGQSPHEWSFLNTFFRNQFKTKKGEGGPKNIRAMAEYFKVPKYEGVIQEGLFAIGYLSDAMISEQEKQTYYASFEHIYPALATTQSLIANMQNRYLLLLSFGYYKKVNGQFQRDSGHMEVAYGFEDKMIYTVDPREKTLEMRPLKIQKNIHCLKGVGTFDSITFPSYGSPCIMSVIHESSQTVTAIEGITYLRMDIKK